MTKRVDAEDRRQQQLRRLGTLNPRCVTCGESDPRVLEQHHIAGQRHDDDVSIVCTNCHRKLSSEQREHATAGEKPREDRMTDIGHYLLGLADILTLIADSLRRFGAWLVGHSTKRVAK
jgi:hypothetical protein